MIVSSSFIALAMATASASTPQLVQVEGRSFNVELGRGQAFVAPRYGILRGYMADAAAVALSRRAAEKASGCKALKSRALPTGVMVKLQCAADAAVR